MKSRRNLLWSVIAGLPALLVGRWALAHAVSPPKIETVEDLVAHLEKRFIVAEWGSKTAREVSAEHQFECFLRVQSPNKSETRMLVAAALASFNIYAVGRGNILLWREPPTTSSTPVEYPSDHADFSDEPQDKINHAIHLRLTVGRKSVDF